MNTKRPSRITDALQIVGLAAILTFAAPGRAQEASVPDLKRAENGAASSAIENSVVKVFSTIRYPEPFRPWTKQPPQEVTGSGVVIDGNRILTNAHVVLYASQVQIQGNKSGDKLSATVVGIAPGIDLAILKLDDESFFATHHPIPRASLLPQIKDSVLAYGFPTGGTSLSITKGIVSRIEFTPYNYPVSGLRIQIDAAINPGNSGGPAIAGDKMIGLAFSNLSGAQNIGYIIPNEEVELFLKDIASGPYQGKPALFDETQRMQNPSLRTYLKLEKSVQGIIVHEPFGQTPVLRKWDVIAKIGESAIDDEGMIELGGDLRVHFDYMVQKIAKDGKIPLTIVRNGKAQQVELPVSPRRPTLLPDLQGTYPSYFVYGPMVFSIATAQMAASINRDSIPGMLSVGNPLMTRRGDSPAFEGEQLVVVSAPFFPHKLAMGFWPPIGWIVKSVNEISIKNLPHLVEVLREAKGDFITIDFFGHGTESFTFPRKETLAATDEILSDNGVRAQGSVDTLAVWNAKSGN